jgi:protein involved in polysaccharide export with SLBB domain
MIGTVRPLRSLFPILLLAGLTAPALAQRPPADPSRAYATRESLEAMYRRYQAAAESPAYSEVLRTHAGELAETVHQRLVNGDFQTGDRVRLAVEGEQALSDTFTVVDGPELMLPTLGAITLKGVLRSEIQPYLEQQIARYIRDPRVQASSYIRISIQGEVQRPGFYTLPTDIVVSDALQSAQGFTPNAKLGDITLVRQNRIVWDAPAMRLAVAAGRTLDQLGVRAGDQIVVAAKPRGLGSFQGGAQTLVYLLTIPAAIGGLLAIFK